MKTLRRTLKRPVYALVERVWLLVFTVVGLVWRPKIGRIEPTGRDFVLAILTHPDDEIFGCAAALASHAAAGDRVRLAVVTDGRASGSLTIPPEEVAAVRAFEFAAAARAMGVEGVQLGLHELDWSESELEALALAELEAVAPNIVYAPSPVDHHPEHRRVAAVVARVAASLASGLPPPEIRAFQGEVPLTPLLANLHVGRGSAELSQSVAAVEAAYGSQQLSVARCRRFLAQSGALWRAGQPIETFWSLSPRAYASVVASAGPIRTFRGIRDRPLTDGLAWIVGLRERRRLGRIAEAAEARAAQRNSTT